MAKKHCYICQQKISPDLLNFKNIELLKRFITPQAKIASRRRTGVCAKHQRAVSREIKRARQAGLLPFTTRVIDTRQSRKVELESRSKRIGALT
jgi:small subunit ribosomal protein S18